MTTKTDQLKAVFYSDGWFEIRDDENTDAWIATENPMERHDV